MKHEFANRALLGVTGNIATGKSTVTAMLAELGAAVIDADAVSRAVVAPGQPALEAITRVFGLGVLRADGALDRAGLGRIVFGDPAALRALEAITHPAVRSAMRAQIATLPVGRVVVLEVIKLFESGWAAECRQVWVTHCPPETQIARLMQFRGMSAADARARVAAQPPQADKLARADVVIDTAGTLAATRAQVARAWTDFSKFAALRSG